MKMKIKTEKRARVDVALGAIVADGCFCLAYTLHLLGSASATPGMADFLGMGLIFCVLLTSCWVIYDDYWLVHREVAGSVVKKLRIRELEQGATIEFDGKSYRVDTINRSGGEILISRVGKPGSIVVQIEAMS
ncbi:MAG: hypothetical protein A2075_20005 [Geobacteraceae bacterium GWC2_58_44]|nr:MAG: hypothetical protein A2075_20005 [Geobacteraceae bacterium GWC2_58_44]HBG08345.1 hypothetical protein [Geobacter sp.]